MMKYDLNVYKRHSIRLKGYDYAQAGAYFVTICLHQGLHLLGNITNQQMMPSDAGLIVQQIWDE